MLLSSSKLHFDMTATVQFLITILLIFFTFHCIYAENNCLNPNHNKGYCITIAECPVLKRLISKASLTDEDKRFLKESSCTDGFGKPPLVCCGVDSTFKDENSAKFKLDNGILPGLEDCGDQPSGSKIYSGMETELDEFPWMALLNYGNDDSPQFFCGGSLINSRYVLTAAHCVVGKKLHSVRLGEYDTSKNIDCIESDCADPVVDVYVENIIIHPNYNIASIHRHNDIALIRLKDEIHYTSFIAPICLPSTIGLQRSDVGTNLVASGWGRTLNEKRSKIKLKVSLPVNDLNQCQSSYIKKGAFLLDSQLCAGGKFIEDACDGDSGGPLMFFKGKWAIEGIVSFSRGCGLENLPGVYTRVAEYEDWIKATIM